MRPFKVDRHSPLHIAAIALDPHCVPQLDPTRDFEPELTYAQRLRNHIEFCVTQTQEDSENPDNIIIY